MGRSKEEGEVKVILMYLIPSLSWGLALMLEVLEANTTIQSYLLYSSTFELG